MKARIKIKNKLYDRIIFAKILTGFKTKVVIFDESAQKLRLCNYWSNSIRHGIKRKVFILDSYSEDWEAKPNICGYDWFISQPNIINAIQKNRQIDNDTFLKCIKMQNDIKIKDYYLIENEIEINNLMNVALGFHDSYVQYISNKENEMIVVLDTCWGCNIIFTLQGNPSTNLKKGFGISGEIFSSSMFFENGNTYWTNNSSINSFLHTTKDDTYFYANKVFVKIEIY